MADEGHSGYLPPEPSGPEPDLGDRGQEPTQPLPPTAETQPYPQHPYPPPQAHPGPQPHPQQPQPQPWQAPYASGPPPGYGYGQPPGWQQPQWGPQHPGWATGPREPDNNQAVAGFSLSLTGGVLLLLSAGFSSFLSLGLSIAGWVYSKKGKTAVESGQTRKHEGLAQAGFVIGIISTILSVLATLGWGGLILAAILSEDFQRELENSGTGTIAIAVLKGAISLL